MQLVGVVAILAWCSIAAADPLDKPPFTATPDELVALRAQLHPDDASIVMLRDERHVDFDERGRRVRRYRVVFVVQKQAGADDWGDFEVDWSPFYQDKPTVRARVVENRDQIAELDPKLSTDTPTVNNSASVYSDRRTLKVPLPRLTTGAIVEEEYAITDRDPLPGGMASHEWMARGVPVGHAIVTLSAPSALNLRVVSRGFSKPPIPQRSTHSGRVMWRYELEPTTPVKSRPGGLPSDISRWPTIGYATAPSWQAVASAYNRIVDKRIADGPFALPSELQRASAVQIVAWLHAHVRYTGIEISDAEIVPWTPADVVLRGFGDCKDQATLLVALLRAAGISADVALLDTGPGLDLDPALFGLGEFDHAIVRAKVNGKDFWIDATEPDLPPGQLPTRDQGRLVLIAAADTVALGHTPTSVAADNVLRQVRTYRAAELDDSRVTEVDIATGVYGDNYRSWFRDSSAKEITKYLTHRADTTYHGKLDRYSGTDPADLAHPFVFTVELSESRRVFTAREQIDAYLFPQDALLELPSLIDGEAPSEMRVNDFVWASPHVVEIENRIVVPPGYSLPPPAPHEHRILGTMTLTIDRRIEGDAYVVIYRLDTGKLRISPSELTATRDAVHELRKSGSEHITIAQTGAELMRAGKAREAVDNYQPLIALHPKEALHYDQLADVYRRLGLGLAARRTARKGVEIEPTSADAHDMLAWQLARDTLGRSHGGDPDRKGAIAEYRKALALNPKHEGALADFAALLSRDEVGRPTAVHADQLEAISLWRRAKERNKGGEYDDPIALELLYAGELGEAEAAARALPDSTRRSTLLVASVVAARGVDTAAQLASSTDRAQVLRAAGGLLFVTRRYALARALVDASGQSDPSWTALTKRIAPVDLARLDPADPKTPALHALAFMMDGELPPAVVSRDLLHDLATDAARFRDQLGPWKELPRSVAEDSLTSIAQFAVEGDAKTGWHVVVDFGPGKVPFYVASIGQRATLIASADSPVELGRTVLASLGKGDVNDAVRWLRWFAADAHETSALKTIARLYKDEAARTGGVPSKDALELLAALLVANKEPKLASPILQRCAIPGEDAKRACDLDRYIALDALGRWSEIIDASRSTSEQDPLWSLVTVTAAHARQRSGDAVGALSAIDAALAKHPDDPLFLAVRAEISVRAEGWEKARAWFDKLLANPNRTPNDLNSAAWFHLYYDATPDTARELGVRVEQLMAKHLPANVANTLATIEAESGRPTTAWAYLQKALDSYTDRMPEESDWYVVGRIAEEVGLRDDAVAAYRRVHKSKHEMDGPTAWSFAARGLARLGEH